MGFTTDDSVTNIIRTPTVIIEPIHICARVTTCHLDLDTFLCCFSSFFLKTKSPLCKMHKLAYPTRLEKNTKLARYTI